MSPTEKDKKLVFDLEQDYSYQRTMLSASASHAFDWIKWVGEIPALQFPSHWRVRMSPPFGGAVVRFRVSTEAHPGEISVYLDCYDQLGIFGAPYWEVYPVDMDTERHGINETKSLLESIAKGLGETSLQP